MKTMNKPLTLLTVLLLSLTSSLTVHARGINWASGIGDNFLTADGTTPMDGSFSFQLGGFTTGFDPASQPLSLWQSNWVVFDSAVSGDGWNPTVGISNYGSLASTVSAGGSLVTSSDTGNTFTIGQQAYIWTYNSKSLASGSEWSLITNAAWTFPAADALALPLDWYLSDPGTSAVGVGATSTDGGTFVSTLQTQAVPEPGSALLIAVAGVLIRLRRRYGR